MKLKFPSLYYKCKFFPRCFFFTYFIFTLFFCIVVSQRTFSLASCNSFYNVLCNLIICIMDDFSVRLSCSHFLCWTSYCDFDERILTDTCEIFISLPLLMPHSSMNSPFHHKKSKLMYLLVKYLTALVTDALQRPIVRQTKKWGTIQFIYKWINHHKFIDHSQQLNFLPYILFTLFTF